MLHIIYCIVYIYIYICVCVRLMYVSIYIYYEFSMYANHNHLCVFVFLICFFDSWIIIHVHVSIGADPWRQGGTTNFSSPFR